MSATPTSRILSINHPYLGPIRNASTQYAQFTIIRPIITVEMIEGTYFVGTHFELEVAVLGNTTRPSTHRHFFKHVKLECDRQGFTYEFLPDKSPQDAFTITADRNSRSAATVTSGAPPPSAGVSLTLSWNRHISVQKKVNSWTVETRHASHDFKWKWTANKVDLNNPTPDVQGSVSWLVSVRRQLPSNTKPEDILTPYKFKIELQVQQRRRWLGHLPLGRFKRKSFEIEAHPFQIPETQYFNDVRAIISCKAPENETIDLSEALNILSQNPAGNVFPLSFPGHGHPLLLRLWHVPITDPLLVDSSLVT